MTAERLRRAAAKLRKLEGDAKSGPWAHGRSLPGHITRSDSNLDVAVADPQTARFIATMHPGVALAVAAWLEATADDMPDAA